MILGKRVRAAEARVQTQAVSNRTTLQNALGNIAARKLSAIAKENKQLADIEVLHYLL